MSNTRTVAILLPDLRGGGAERVCLNLANNFVRRGLRVQMVLMRTEGEFLPQLDPRVEVADLGVARVRNALWPLVRYLRQTRPTALLANMWPLTILAVLARMLSGTPCRLVVVEHITWSASPLVRRWRTRITSRLTMRWLLTKADVVIAVSRGAATDLEQFAGLRTGAVQALYNPLVKTSAAALGSLSARFQSWAVGGHKRVLAVGALKAQKDFSTLLKAFSQVSSQIDARLLILGEGEERAKLEAQIRTLELEGFVDLAGFVEDTAPVYAHADLFVLSSDHEGFGNVIVEALEQGVPVVSTDCPFGPREILEDGKYGALVPVGDVGALAQAMLESLRTAHDHAALKTRARDFAVDTISDQYLDRLLPGWRERKSA